MNPSHSNFSAVIKEISTLIPNAKIEQRLEWQDQQLSDHFFSSYCVIDQCIVYGFSYGFLDPQAVHNLNQLHLKIIREGIPAGQDYIHIINLSGMPGTSLDARAQYLKYLLSRGHMAALIFTAPNPLFKMSIKLTQRVVKYGFDLFIAKNEAEAFQQAYHWLEFTPRGKAISAKSLDKRQIKVFKSTSAEFKAGEFSTLFDLLEPDVIHAEPIGELREEHIEPLFQKRFELLKTVPFPEKGFFSIIDLSKLMIDRKARLSYVQHSLKTHKDLPIRMLIFYKGSRLMHAGYLLSKSFLPFPSKFVSTLEEVRQIIKEAKSGQSLIHKEPGHPSQEIIDKILLYMANLDWEKASGQIKIPDNVDPVYHPVFEVITLLKHDFDKQIEERKLAQEMLKTSLEEKELLLREIHHRIKNNLQLIMSMLDLQKRKIKEESLRQILEVSGNRVYSMAAIHDILYQSGNLANIDFSKYIRSISMYLSKIYDNRQRPVYFHLELDPVMLSITTSIPAGLIINEILTNSLKYAFPDSFQDSPEIYIGLRENENSEVELAIRDNGIGIPQMPAAERKEWVGLRMIEMLAKHQLEGELDMSFDDGTQFIITFKN